MIPKRPLISLLLRSTKRGVPNVARTSSYSRQMHDDRPIEGIRHLKDEVYKIALTGGPCAGKSSALMHMSMKLQQHGFKVFTVPEAATLVFSNGAEFVTLSHAGQYNLIKTIMKLQIALEDSFAQLAHNSGQKSVLICDRGVLDNQAYFPDPQMWNMVLTENKWTLPGLRERRYDQVIHLVTTAVGAESFYTNENNAVRRESPAQAAELDCKVLDAYIGHPRLSIVDNRTDFTKKMDRALHQMYDLVGIDDGNSDARIIYRRYRIKNKRQWKRKEKYSARKLPINSQQIIKAYFHDRTFDSFVFPAHQHYADITIEKTFLKKKDTVRIDRDKYIDANVPDRSYIYRRGQAGSYQYFYRQAGTRKPRLISVTEFLSHMDDADPEMATLHERVRYFIYNYHYFALIDVGEEQFLEVGADAMTINTLELPPFIIQPEQSGPDNAQSVEIESADAIKWELFDANLAKEMYFNNLQKENNKT